MKKYQVAVIGSGSAGGAATVLAARQGLLTALIEKDRLGGTAFHSGSYAVCGLLGCARQYRDTLQSERFGNQADVLHSVLTNWRVAQWGASTRLSETFEAELKQPNVDVYHGHAEIVSEQILKIVRASGARIEIHADSIIVATGSRPDFADTSNPRLVNSDTLLRMATCPRRLAIIGGGHIGCEFASIYRTLGSEVTLIERENRLLSAWEPEASERVAGTLENRGVVLRLNQEISSDQIIANQSCVQIWLPNQESIEVDLVLVATGRRPNSTNLGLQELGIDDTSFLNVDTQMRLPRTGLYAVGDVNGMSLLDSTAFAQANVAIRHIMGYSTPFDHRFVPRCIHTDPCVAAVGWTQEDANEQGNEYRVVSDTMFLVSDTPRSVIDPEPTFVKVVTDAKSNNLLGCLVVGDHAPAIANTAAMVIRSGISINDLPKFGLIRPSATEALVAALRKL